MKKLILILVGLFVSLGAFSQAPKFSNDFLNIGVGARGMALAGAVTSTSSDINSAYWNPANMVFMDNRFQVAAQHAEWYSGIGNYDYVAAGKSLDAEKRSYGGISLIRMGIDNIPNTLRLRGPDGSIDYSRITTFSVSDYALLVSYARKLGKIDKESPWSVGANVKIIHRSFGSFAKSFGFGIDVGLSYQMNKWKLGIMGRDLTTTFNAYKFNFSDEEKATLQLTGNTVPGSSIEITLPKVIIGISKEIPITKKLFFLPALDIEFSGNGTKTQIIQASNFGIDPKIGFEFDYLRKVFLRFGLGNFQSVPSIIKPTTKDFTFQPSGGLGLKLGRVGIDYALTNIANLGVGLYSNYISLKLDFN